MIQPQSLPVLSPLPQIPNSPLPALYYRRAISLPSDQKNPHLTSSYVRAKLEPHGWYYNGTFKAYFRHHFHAVTHECYVVLRGSSDLILGGRSGVGDGDSGLETGEEDKEGKSVTVSVSEGDAIVLPAGVAHSSLRASPDYEYIGLYPDGSPHYDNNFCKASVEETAQKAAIARAVPIPLRDPINGESGPLTSIWRRALDQLVSGD